MWVKEHPKEKGNFWIRRTTSENKVYKEIVYLYNCKIQGKHDDCYWVVSFGEEQEEFANSMKGVEWWDKKLKEPSENSYSKKLYTSGGVIEFLNEKGYKGDSFEGAIVFAISVGLDVAISSTGYIVESRNNEE